MTVTIPAAHRIAPVVPHQGPPGELSLCGALLLQSALAAAACGDGPSVRELLGQAAEIAKEVGGSQDQHWTSFGPIVVALARVVTDAELGDAGAAVSAHEQVAQQDAWSRLPAEDRAAYLIDVARAYLQVGDLAGAGRALADADRIAAAEVRSRPAARTVLAAVLRGGPPPAGVAQLATALGVT